jgi:peptidoglycan/LPS O-acetylase OafA/YrhL
MKQPDHLALKYRPDIDGLRAIAVLAVVIFHAFPSSIQGGFIGVDIFFVISGYLISSILFENLEHQTFGFWQFYEKRIVRIFPALIVVLLFSYGIGWFVLFADEYQQLGKHIAGGASFISNFIFWQEVGYFDNAAATKPLLHLWSLGIEEQFYIIWPLLLWLFSKRSLHLLILSSAIALASFALNLVLNSTNPIADFYSPLTRFWELMAGCLLAWFTLYRPTLLFTKHSYTSLASIAGLVLLAFGFFIIHEDQSFPGYWALVPVIGSVLMIAAGPQALINRTLLSNRIVVWFGLISFPLYLWHWPLMVFARIFHGEVPSKPVRVVLVLVSIALAWLTYRFIERPIRFGWQSRLKAPLLIFVMAITGALGYYTQLKEGFDFRSLARQSSAFQYSEAIEGYLPCNLKPGLREILPQGLDLNYCVVNAKQSPNAVIIGDSHAEDKFHGLVSEDGARRWMLMGNANCPPVLGIALDGEQKDCQKKFEWIYPYLQNNPAIDNVIISFYGIYFQKENYPPNRYQSNFSESALNSALGADQYDVWQRTFYLGLDAGIKNLIQSGKKVTLLLDVPELPSSPRDCVRNQLKRCEVSREEAIRASADARGIIAQLKKSNPSLVIYDPLDFLCDQHTCSYKQGDTILYRDTHHLSLQGSNLLTQHWQSLAR